MVSASILMAAGVANGQCLGVGYNGTWKTGGGASGDLYRLARAAMEQFRKEMKNSQVVEIKGSTHYVFVGASKEQTIKLMRDFLLKEPKE